MQSPSFALVRRTLTQLYMCEAVSRPWELYNCSKMIPLAKGAGPSVRPIAVPTAWHKVASSLITKLLLPEFKTATAGTQHGIGLKNGAGVLVERVRTLMKEYPTQAIAQIDISNAFGCIDREAASRVLARHTHNAARVLNRWLTSTQWATCQRSTTEYVVLPTREGIPQGDPASAALFTVTLQTAIDAAVQLHESDPSADDPATSVAVLAYIDDLTVVAPPERLPQVLHDLAEALEAVGLRVNAAKTQVYLHPTSPIPDTEQWQNLLETSREP